MTDMVNVKGLKELDQFLKTLPHKIQRNVVRGAMRAAANTIKKEAQSRAPVGPPAASAKKYYGGYRGALRDSIRVATKAKGGRISGFVRVGGKSRKTGANVFYAHMIEFGTRPHKIEGPIKLGKRWYRDIDHPGTAPHPFLRPALDSRAMDAVIAAGEYIKRRLAKKHGIDTSDIEIEGDE